MALGCTKKSDESKAPAAATPEFDQKWSALADKELEVFYIEDDRGEGLMGNVRRAKRGSSDARDRVRSHPRRIDRHVPQFAHPRTPRHLHHLCEQIVDRPPVPPPKFVQRPVVGLRSARQIAER